MSVYALTGGTAGNMSLPLGVLLTFGANDHTWARHASHAAATMSLRAISTKGYAGQGAKERRCGVRTAARFLAKCGKRSLRKNHGSMP